MRDFVRLLDYTGLFPLFKDSVIKNKYATELNSVINCMNSNHGNLDAKERKEEAKQTIVGWKKNINGRVGGRGQVILEGAKNSLDASLVNYSAYICKRLVGFNDGNKIGNCHSCFNHR